jgi:hypothetical protein
VTQSPYPSPQDPYRVVGDPQQLCRRAGIFTFIFGMLVALVGVLLVAVMSLKWQVFWDMMQQQQRAATQATSRPASPWGEMPTEIEMRAGMMVMSSGIIAVGLALMILASFIRRGAKGATITAMVIVAVSGVVIVLNIGTAAMSPGSLAGGCCLTVPLSLAVWLFISLLQAVRAISEAQHARMMQAMGFPPCGPAGYPPAGWKGMAQIPGSAGTPPPQSPTSPAMPAPPPASVRQPMFTMPPAPSQPPPGNAGPQHLFGPAPFGIPPPPDDLPPGRYGYATRPPPPPPKAVSPPPSPPPAEPPTSS